MHIIFRKFFYGVSVDDKINFARHLSIVIKAGLPILDGLKIIKKQTTSRVLGKIIESIVTDLSNGQFLATSMERFPEVFDDFFINVVRVGEASGTLSANLAYIAEELRKSQELKRKIVSAMIYPIVIFVATVALTAFLVFFTFPKVLPIFSSLRVSLPLSTRILIAVSQFVTAHWLFILVTLAVLIIVLRALLSIRFTKRIIDRLKLALPVLSGLVVAINMANFARVLAVLLRGGVKIVEAITITAQTFDHLVYRETLLETAEAVRKGEQLADFLARKKIFPSLLVGLVEIGENTGNLEENLVYLSEYYRDEAERSLRNLTTLLEPFLLVTMGLLVGFVAVSIITPIYQVTQTIGR